MLKHSDIELIQNDRDLPKDAFDSLMLTNIAHLLIDIRDTTRDTTARVDALVNLLVTQNGFVMGALTSIRDRIKNLDPEKGKGKE